MWFSGQIALGLRGCCCRDLCCVVYGDEVCRLRLSCSCWICCGTGYSGGILTEDVNVKASIFANKGNNTGNKTPRLFHDLPQFFFLSSAIICCLSLLSGLIPPAHFLKASSCRTSNLCHMFSLQSHPALSIFILDSITFFGFSGDSFHTILLCDACCCPTDLCRSWRMAVPFSAWIAAPVALCVL